MLPPGVQLGRARAGRRAPPRPCSTWLFPTRYASPWTARTIWLTRATVVPTAVGCAVLFAVLNAGIVAVAAHLADPEAPLAKVLWDRESLLLDLTEIVRRHPGRGHLRAELPAAPGGPAAGHPAAAQPDAPAAGRRGPHRPQDRAAERHGLAARGRRGGRPGAGRSGAPLALLLVDVDHFKRVNDSHGHLIGDDVLRALATELRQQVRESDVVGRFGGEEFTVLLPRTDADGACRIAERLRSSAGLLSVAAADASDQRHGLDRGGGARPARQRPVRAARRRPTWRCTGPRTPAGTRCACMPRGQRAAGLLAGQRG